jgi:hypothetical protein
VTPDSPAGGPGLAAVEQDASATGPAPLPAAEARSYGRIVLHDYESCEAQYRGAIFSMLVTEQDEVDLFSHAPYEKYGATEHAGLSPMFFEVTVRGRLEPDEEGRPTLTLKAPQNVREYFEFKNVPEEEWSAGAYARMVRDEYVRVARKLLETGMPPGTAVLVDRLQEFFPEDPDLIRAEPFSLDLLANRSIATRASGSGQASTT